LAVDVDDLPAAVKLVERLDPWFGVVKIGLELFVGSGPAVMEALAAPGRRLFLDLKLHDIPNTVARAAMVAGRLGADLLTLHAAGGPAMLRAGAEGLAAGASEAGRPAPIALGVTVLTSDPDTSAFAGRLADAVEGGCGGVVCSMWEVARVKEAGPALVTVVPGIRLPGGETHDQARVGSPGGALAGGADILVVGRAVTAAPDPEAAAMALTQSVVEALENGAL
jgi:orotidine-5'-phosphate decarboxylase